MASNARKQFDKNVSDIDRLLELHNLTGGDARGRRFGLEVLNKSAIVLITSYWEAYCEDLASEALLHLVKHSKKANDLPKELKKLVVKELNKDTDVLAVWVLADKGWKQHLKSRLEKMKEIRDRKLNTPKTAQIDDLFKEAIGVSKVSSAWSWARKMNVTRARDKLDKYVSLRGAIAHRGTGASTVTRADVLDYFDFIKKLAAKTGGRVNKEMKDITGKPLWE